MYCVAGTVGAELDPSLDAGAGTALLSLVDLAWPRGLFDDDYSGFKAIDVCVSPEVCCVAATAGDALAEGYAVRLLSDLSAATSLAAAQPVEVELAAVGSTVATTGVLR